MELNMNVSNSSINSRLVRVRSGWLHHVLEEFEIRNRALISLHVLPNVFNLVVYEKPICWCWFIYVVWSRFCGTSSHSSVLRKALYSLMAYQLSLVHSVSYLNHKPEDSNLHNLQLNAQIRPILRCLSWWPNPNFERENNKIAPQCCLTGHDHPCQFS